MNRNPHFLVTGMQKYDVCGSEMIYLKGSAYEKPFPIQYFPNPEHNLDNCEGCKNTHQKISCIIIKFVFLWGDCSVLSG